MCNHCQRIPAEKEWHPPGCTYPVLEDVDFVSILYLAANKIDDPGVISSSDRFFVVPFQDIARFTLDKGETMCICMEFLLSSSHVLDHVWLPGAKGDIARFARPRCIRGDRVHLEGCRALRLTFVPINIGQ